MQTFNTHFTTQTELLHYISRHNLHSFENILIQIFSGIVDEKKCLEISSFLKSELPSSHIIGTTTAGEILDAQMYDETILISFSVFKSTMVRASLFDLNKKFNIKEVEKRLIRKNTKALIIFSDGLCSNAEELLRALTQTNPHLVIAGGRAADFIKFEKTFVFNEKMSTENGFVIASLSGDELIVNNDYMLDWNQIGKEMIVTKADGNRVYEVDNMEIKELYKKYLGSEVADNLPSAGTEFPLVTMRNGVEVARSPIAILEDGALLFGGNLNVGEKVRFAYGNVDDIKDSIYTHNIKLAKLPIESIFIYSCSGRKTLMGKELEIEFKMLNSLAPTVGFFTYGEYFHSLDVNEVLNITTTFLAISESKKTSHKRIYATKKYTDNRILKALTHLSHEATQEVEFQNKELFRLNDMISKLVLYSTSDLDGNIMSISKAYLSFLKMEEKDVIGKNHSIFRHPETPDNFYDRMWYSLHNNKRFVGELKNRRVDGSDYWIQITIDPIFNENGKKVGYSSYREDITDKKLLEYLSSHDPLTLLHNRGAFITEIKAAIQKIEKKLYRSFGFILFDIDNFKQVNDKYGHKVGDDVLIKLSRSLEECMNQNDFLARWGGEEFVIISYNADIRSLITLVEKIQYTISQTSFKPVEEITLSFGITLYMEKDTKDSLLKRADYALYRAKENGRNRYELDAFLKPL